MRSGCPATGRMFHYFDKETHRCKCGRWERGFAPKKETTPKHGTGECQVCASTFCLDKHGRLVNHGFQRPGYGWLVGGCHGAGRLPYPATDALLEIIVIAHKREQEQANRKLELEAGSHEDVWTTKWFEGDRYTKSGYRPVKVAKSEITYSLYMGAGRNHKTFGSDAYLELEKALELECGLSKERIEELKSEWFQKTTFAEIQQREQNIKEIKRSVVWFKERVKAAQK